MTSVHDGGMRELRFTGLSPDGRTLLASDPAGEEYRIPVDEIFAAAVRERPRSAAGDVAPGRDLRPAEIQSEIRAGATPEQLAEITGMDLDRIERFAAPVMQERAWVAQRASRILVTGGPSPRTLLEYVLLHAERTGLGIEAADLVWDAWRRDNGRWSVAVELGDEEAVWLFDPDVNSLAPDDDLARSIHGLTRPTPVGPAPEGRSRRAGRIDAPEPDAAANPAADTGPLPRSRPRPAAERPGAGGREDTVPIGRPRPEPRAHPVSQTGPDTAPQPRTRPADQPTEVIPPTHNGPRRRRATVPSWDEILFGARPED